MSGDATRPASPTPGAAMPWREGLWVALALLGIALLALRPSIRGNDGYGNYVYLASLLRGGDLDFSDEYAAIDAREHYAFQFSELPRDAQTGRPSNRYGVGAPLLWAPFVAIAHGALSLIQPAAATGFGPAYAWGVGCGTAFWGTLGLWLLYRRMRRSVPRWAAGIVLLGLIFATPLGFYLYAHGSMSHGVSFFAAVGLMLAFEAAWRRPFARELGVCAAWCALLTMIRAQDASWAMLTAGALAWRVLGDAQRPVRVRAICLAAAAGIGVLCCVPQLAAWKVLYGTALAGPAPYLDDSAGSFSPWPAHLLQGLFSARHGALAWHPLLALALGGCAGLAVRRDEEDTLLARFALAGFAVQAWLVGCWSVWWAGASFGNRFFISAFPWLALGLAWLLARARARWARAGAIAVIFGLCVWNMGLLLQYATEMIPREEAVSWHAVARHNVVDLPKWLWRRVAG